MQERIRTARERGDDSASPPPDLVSVSSSSSSSASVTTTSDSSDSDSDSEDTVVVQQHLLITPHVDDPDDTLQSGDRNLAGQRLLPRLEPKDWPKPAAIAAAQRNLDADIRQNLTKVEHESGTELLVDANDRIVLPHDDPIIPLICTVAHQGTHGHSSPEQTEEDVAGAFNWTGIKGTVKQWCLNCMQCIKLQGGRRIPRPMGHQLVATQPMEVIALDYLDLPKDRHGVYVAVLIIVDQLTRTCVVVPTKDKTAATAAKILHERWLSLFPDPAFVVTDGGTHFRCALFREIARIRGFQHHIVAPHCQFGNGGVERLNRVFLRSMRALISAQRKDISDWPRWSSVVQEALNKVLRVKSRGNKTPAQLLTGVIPATAVARLTRLGVHADAIKADAVPEDVLLAHLDDIHASMELLWAKAVDGQLRRQKQNERARAKKRRRKENIPRIQVGDAVLVARANNNNKLQMTWTGPHQVVNAISPYVYEVEPMLPVRGRRRRIIAHIVRIRRFSNGLLGTPADRKRIEQEALRDYPDNVVKRFVGHKVAADGQLTVTVRWLGYDRAHDTDEPAHQLAQDVPNLLEEYLRLHQGEGAIDRTLNQFFRA